MMKILHVIDSAGLYGAEHMLLALVAEQINLGLHPVILSCGDDVDELKAIEAEAENRKLPFVKWRMKAGLNIKGAWNIAQYAKKENVSVIHSHGYKFNVLFALIPRFLCKIPKISTVHGYVVAPTYSAMWLYQILDKICLSRMQAVVFVSQETQKLFSKLKKQYVIQNGITVEPQSNKCEQRFKNKELRLLGIGRLAEEKGFKYLIEAINSARDSGRFFTLDIMGTGPENYALQKLVQDVGLGEQVNFLQFVDNPSQYFDDYDLLVMPSLTEGLPITLLEALREGLPVLATNVGEIPHVINEHYPLIDKDTELETIYSKIVDFEVFYRNGGKQITERLYQRFSQKYSAIEMASQYENVYLGL